jgi:hypothetical protein
VRPQEGAGGSDRIVLIWADGAITNTWLEVTLKANDNTALASPDVFYFGSRVGDTGSDNNPLVLITDAQDPLEARFNQGIALSLTNVYDFDRDGTVSAGDEVTARFNQGFTPLIHVVAPQAASAAGGAALAMAVDLAVVELTGDGEQAGDEAMDELLPALAL